MVSGIQLTFNNIIVMYRCLAGFSVLTISSLHFFRTFFFIYQEQAGFYLQHRTNRRGELNKCKENTQYDSYFFHSDAQI